MIDLRPILDRTLLHVHRASQFIAQNYGTLSADDVEVKDLNSLVSFVDKGAEGILVEGLKKTLPESGFLTEEDTVENIEKDYTWIIDPLDGTTNFLNEIPLFTVSVALSYRGDVVLGVVRDVMNDETFTAIKGHGAYLNENPIQVSQKKINDVLIATGFPYTNDYPIQKHFDIIKHWLTEARGIRRLGSAALDLAYVACGRFGAYYEDHLNPWDVSAGTLIVKEAGGVVKDYQGGDQYNLGNVISGSPQVFGRVYEVIKHHFVPSHLTKVEHLGIAVENLDEAEKIYTSLLGVKPYKREEVKSEHVITSFFKVGTNKVELLAPTSEESTIHKFLQKNRPGIHHIAYAVDDIIDEMERLEKLGFILLNKEPKKGADNKMICFLHPKSTGGSLIELCQEISDK